LQGKGHNFQVALPSRLGLINIQLCLPIPPKRFVPQFISEQVTLP
jgi:hypothetical protein